MSPTSPAYDSSCTIARSLDVLGPRWNLLILREAHNGVTRFADFKQLLGIAPDVLSDRLAGLVEAGILEKHRYQAEGERARDDYRLTQKGLDLKIVLAALQQWGDAYVATELGPTVTRRERTSHDELDLAFVDAAGRVVPEEAVYFEPVAGTPAARRWERYREAGVEHPGVVAPNPDEAMAR